MALPVLAFLSFFSEISLDEDPGEHLEGIEELFCLVIGEGGLFQDDAEFVGSEHENDVKQRTSQG